MSFYRSDSQSKSNRTWESYIRVDSSWRRDQRHCSRIFQKQWACGLTDWWRSPMKLFAHVQNRNPGALPLTQICNLSVIKVSQEARTQRTMRDRRNRHSKRVLLFIKSTVKNEVFLIRKQRLYQNPVVSSDRQAERERAWDYHSTCSRDKRILP